MRALFYRISIAINEWTGGDLGQTLCARMARKYGSDCWFCKAVGLFLGKWHCVDEMIFDLKRKRGV